MPLVECVPNFSEGRRPEVIAAIRDAIAGVADVTVLDVSSDPSHNRTVVTFVAPSSVAVQAAFNGIAKARELIDLTTHQGEHPRIGATDVCPFIPLEGATMDDCVALARELGQRVGDELGIPVFLYERAATRPDRQNLADIRRGEFELARTEIGTNPDRVPDFGPNAVHPTAGATVIGARPFLVAYNVYLGGVENLQVAKDVAKAVRGSSGGFRYVKALGLEVDGQAQVSMNLVDTDQTPLSRVFDFVRTEAEARGVTPDQERARRPGAGEGAVRDGGPAHPAARLLHRHGARAQGARRAGRRVAERLRRECRGQRTGAGRRECERARRPARGGARADGRRAHGRAEEVRRGRGGDDGARRSRPLRLGARLGALVQEDADAYALVSAAYKLPGEGDAPLRASESASRRHW